MNNATNPAHIARGAAIAISVCGLWSDEFFPGWIETNGSTAQEALFQRLISEYGGPPPMCTLGAIRFAASGTAASEGGVDLDPVFEALADHLWELQGRDEAREEIDAAACDVIVEWSDSPGRSAEDVAAALEATALALEDEAVCVAIASLTLE